MFFTFLPSRALVSAYVPRKIEQKYRCFRGSR
jgi:hypothetical protein